MKITEKLAAAEREGRSFWSFEYFPPRTAQVSSSPKDLEQTEYADVSLGFTKSI